MILFFREDSFIDFVRRNVPETFRGVGVLLLDVFVKIEVIDFFYIQELNKTAKKYHNYTRKMFNTAIETTIRGSFWNLTFLEEGSRCLGETSKGPFSGQNR